MHLICGPAIPTVTDFISNPERSSASFSDALIDSIVFPGFTTIPLDSPLEGAFPTPRIFSRPSARTWATIVQILVVPTSRPTITFSISLFFIWFSFIRMLKVYYFLRLSYLYIANLHTRMNFLSYKPSPASENYSGKPAFRLLRFSVKDW